MELKNITFHHELFEIGIKFKTRNIILISSFTLIQLQCFIYLDEIALQKQFFA